VALDAIAEFSCVHQHIQKKEAIRIRLVALGVVNEIFFSWSTEELDAVIASTLVRHTRCIDSWDGLRYNVLDLCDHTEERHCCIVLKFVCFVFKLGDRISAILNGSSKQH